LERLNRHGISTTLVVTVKKGVNDLEIGRIIDFALTQPCVRGVTLQPVQVAGRRDSRPLPSGLVGDGVRAQDRWGGRAAHEPDRSQDADRWWTEHDRLRE